MPVRAAPTISDCMSQPGFLLVTADEGLFSALVPALQSFSVVRRARNHSEALSALRTKGRWAGVVLDLDHPERERGDFLGQLRELQPLVSVLAVTSRASVELVNRVHAFRAELVLKPVGSDNLLSFARRGLAHAYLPDERVAARIDALARERSLTVRECQLLIYTLGNDSRLQMLRRLGVSPNTLKTQVRALLRKCQAPCMDTLATMVLRDALVFEAVGPCRYAEERQPMRQAM